MVFMVGFLLERADGGATLSCYWVPSILRHFRAAAQGGAPRPLQQHFHPRRRRGRAIDFRRAQEEP
ncbi:MAG: hypothetical protein K8F57_01740, partial [Alphaproteobacteria bacterium]|nr:hypothetical protein [Alphaproteobacteria bacterium]